MLRQYSKSRGFTIIELITIIAVIGILVSISVVSWNGVQNQARRSDFQANADQVKLKLGEYFTEHNSYYKTKAEVESYLDNIGAPALSDTFSAAAYQYATAPGACTTAGSDCASYTITIPATNFGGGDNIVVTP